MAEIEKTRFVIIGAALRLRDLNNDNLPILEAENEAGGLTSLLTGKQEVA